MSVPVATSRRPAAYVGVSGVVSPAQQDHLEALAVRTGLSRARTLLLGVKGVHKTQYLDVENKYGTDWYPVGPAAFATALRPRDAHPAASADPDALCATMGVAQLYLDVAHVDDPAYRRHFMTRIVDRGRPWLTGVQFDMLPWHHQTAGATDAYLDFLTGLRQTGLTVLLQCHGHAMAALGPARSAQRLAELSGALDYVLFDSSHGTGTRLDVDVLAPFLHAAHSHPDLEHVGIGVAGGLDAGVVESDLTRLLDDHPDLSWDAEGALHPSAGPTGSRPLDPTVVADYLTASSHVLSPRTT